jgi:hypothetical protein
MLDSPNLGQESPPYTKAMRELASAIQIMLYRRESSPIRDREEVNEDLARRLVEIARLARNGKTKWRRGLLELAAYAIFAAVSDE